MMSGLSLVCPDYTTLSKRGKKLNLDCLLDSKDKDFDYVCLDSTGIQIYTGNEWLENKHVQGYIRRTWRKLHMATGNDGLIISAITTRHNKNDRSQVEASLTNVNTHEVIADPGYDGENIYQLLRAKGVKPTIRPPNQLMARKAKTERQQSAAYQQTKGYHAWRNKNKYGRRELVENTLFRFKNSFGSKFLSR